MPVERRRMSLGDKITPYLVTISIFILGGVLTTVNKIDDKLFKHLTNDDIHVVRSTVVSKAEFDIVTEMRKMQFTKIEAEICNLSRVIEKRVR